MYCLPLDDVCQWERFQHKLVAEPAENYLIDSRSFELGRINGCIYTYVWDAKHPVIFVDDVNDPSDRPKILKGK